MAWWESWIMLSDVLTLSYIIKENIKPHAKFIPVDSFKAYQELLVVWLFCLFFSSFGIISLLSMEFIFSYTF